MNTALGLYRLQQVDSQMDKVRARIQTIRETLENDLELRSAKEAFSAAEKNHHEAVKALKSSEAEVEKQRIKIEQTESSLYSGSVHNPKELQDLQRDIVSLKKHLTTLEERELEVMIAAEQSEQKLEAAQKKLNDVQLKLKDQNVELANENGTLNKELERLESERKAVTGDFEGQALNAYEKLRQQKRGIAVASISDNSCEACGTTLTASQQQNARSLVQLFHCPTCGRVIYAG